MRENLKAPEVGSMWVNKFKDGDVVIVTDANERDVRYFKWNKTDQITDIGCEEFFNNYRALRAYNKGNSNEKVQKMPEHEFKVGDWVEYIGQIKKNDLLTDGSFHRIQEISLVGKIRVEESRYFYEKSDFKPAIPEVGSRWISNNNFNVTVKLADGKSIVYETTDGTRLLIESSFFLTNYKPEPKTTVRYLNLYENHMRLQHCKDREDARSRRFEKGYLATIKVETDGAGKTTTTQVDLEWE